MDAPPGPPASGAPEESPAVHEQDVESREAFQYWGYLFKADKTGTDKLKSLLRGLKERMNEHYEPSDNPDLTPTQLATFYRELNGNYDQLFLGTPSESIAFIYKSLGCMHSLQPLSRATAFTDPTVPALKTEGWVMWQTIQLLLGPDEHSSFLIEAVQKWDVKDPVTGEVFPKILPRQSFPADPDKHMVAWYEGVSDRLRREAEDEERQRDVEAQQAEVRRLHGKREGSDDEGSVDSRAPALAYFRNPLYRHVDGRPSIVRRNSKRPTLSPRPTMIDKGKGAATTVGHVIRNIGSPHLWDGRHKSHSRDPERDHRRRSSLPNNQHHHGEGPEANLSPGSSRRKRSSNLDRLPTGSSEDDYQPPIITSSHSPRPASDDREATLRHSRSHEPTPSQKEYPDYFYGYDNPSRRNSETAETPSPAPTPNGVGPSFGPSASPLFASHVAKQPGSQIPREQLYHSRRAPPMRRVQERPYSRSPDPSSRPPRDDRDFRHRDDRDGRHSRDRRSRFDESPPRSSYDDGYDGAPEGRHRSRSGQVDHRREGSGHEVSRDGERERRARRSGSEVSGNGGGGGRVKQTRFADGVDGRRYPDEAPWRG